MTGGALMYGGTEGSSGSDASHERAAREARDGTATARQTVLLDSLAGAGAEGLTWRELGTATGLHHGQVTGGLSNLHKAGMIARLTVKRGRCSVYVLPEHVDGRTTVAQGRRDAETSPVGFPFRQGPHLVLGPDVHATLDGEFIVWQGRRYHPVDVHDSTRVEQEDDQGRRPLFDLD
ncbi:winged helix-turn-helix DNA binding domain protein [Microbacterium phage Gingerbug]|nr:winged helix-turn-helix DNA binding domain protein [Microbacterium phage Gingerbug]